ncbi:MAG: pre-peptidase C-terminal domain-containing protein, partial [Rivularia sp. (in: cyanobacteria)]
MSTDNAENLLSSSTPLNSNQDWQVIQDTLSLNNKNDYYSLQLTNRSKFNLVLNDLSDNADVKLLNNSGSEIASSSSGGTNNEQINLILDTGTYFIQVHQVDDTEISYGLEYRSNYIAQEFEFNTEAIEGGIRLTDVNILDDDGDLEKFDFWLKKQGENWKKVGPVSEFSSNNDGSIELNYDIGNLEEGEYYIWGRATDEFGSTSNGFGKVFTVANIVNPEVENVAPTNLGFTVERISGGIKLKHAKVYDANGADDIERVDFQLKEEGGEWIDIDDALDFSQNQDDSIGFDYSINGLEQGNYELKATAYDRDGAASEPLKTYFRVSNVAPTELSFEVEVIENGFRLTDTRLFDANGINDLSRVDFWLKKEGGNWQNIADAVEFRPKIDGSIGFDYSIDSLEKGNYILWARVRDGADNYSNSWQQSFTIGNSAPSQLDFDLQEIDGGIELNNAKVFDLDGADDLEKIDFQLKEESGEWIDIDDALNFSTNQDSSIGFNYSINGLEQGNYQLKATAYDKAGEKSEALTTYFKVNNFTPTEFNFDIEVVEDGVRVINTQVFDANGIDDLSRVDFWLKKDDRAWENIADAVEFRSNENGSFSFDYSIDSLESGDYVLWARSRDKADSYSNISQKSFQIIDTSQPEKDWFELNIQDESIRTLTKSLSSDNNLSRNDMLSIFDDVGNNGVVDATEMNDLRTIIENASDLGMQDYVRVLSNKVVNGDV